MKQCDNCGLEIEEGVVECPFCGSKTETGKEKVEHAVKAVEEKVEDAAEKAKDAVADVTKKAEATVDTGKEKVEHAVKAVEEKVEDTAEKAKDAVADVAEKAEATVDTGKEKVEHAVKAVEEKVEDAAEKAKDAVADVTKKAETTVDTGKEKVGDIVKNVEEKLDATADVVQEKAAEAVKEVGDEIQQIGKDVSQVAEAIGEKQKKKSGGLILLVLLLIAAVIAGVVFITKNIGPGKKDLSDPLFYRTESGTINYISDTLKSPVSFPGDSASTAEMYDLFKTSDDQKYISYITDEQDLVSIPVSSLGKEAIDSIDAFKVDSGVANIFGYSADNKYLLYQNSSYELMVYNGTKATKLDSDVNEAIFLAKGYVVYVKVNQEESIADLKSWKIGENVDNITEIAKEIGGFYLTNIRAGEPSTEIVYLTQSEGGYNAFSYDVEKEKHIAVVEDANLGVLVSVRPGNEIIYSTIDTGVSASDNSDVTEIQDSMIHNLYYYKNGKEKLISEGVDEFYSYDDINKAIVYREVIDGEYRYIYQVVGKGQQVFFTDTEKRNASITIDDKSENMSAMFYSPSEEMSVEQTYGYPIKSGKIGAQQDLGGDVLYVHGHTVANKYIYFKDMNEETGNVSIYAKGSGDEELIAEDVSTTSIISDYGYKGGEPFLYMVNAEISDEITQGTLMAYNGKETKEVSGAVWAGNGYEVPIKYVGDKAYYIAYYMKDDSLENEFGSLYAYDSTNGTSQLVADEVASIF